MIYNSRPARFYGLPKVHKPQLSLRPIISSISCPNSRIAHLVTEILTSSYNKDNPYYVPDSFHFAEFVNDMIIPPNFVLVSFDVVSLFTNIPLRLLLDSIAAKWDTISNHTDIPLFEFQHLVSFIFDTTFFTFNGTFYRQVFGTPMGSEVSPIAAQYVMDMVLDSCTAVLDFQIPFMKKYVDDIICVLPSSSVQDTLSIFNSYHPNIQFTIEQETNGTVPFLDTLVIRENQVLKTNWYMKPTASGRYINYHSYHSTKMKMNTILNMKNRITRLSHPTFLSDNLKKFADIMVHNSFPKQFINRLLFRTRAPSSDHNHPPQQDNAVQQDPQTDLQEATPIRFYRSLPYHHRLSQQLTQVLKQIPGLLIAHKNHKTIGQLFSKIKDPTPLLLRSNVVYSIPCSGCNQVYIGQTSRSLSARITSHRSDVRLNKSSCQLSIHANHTGHTINYGDVKVLDTEIHTKKREFLEMTYIASCDTPMNSRKDIDGLSDVYMFLLLQYQDRRTHRAHHSITDDSFP